MTAVRIGLVGDYSAAVTAHRAIPEALALAGRALGVPVAGEWIPTDTLAGGVTDELATCQGIWCVPASPYRSEAGALLAIRFAREQRRPYLGTCGGFQHAVLEYARHVAGMPEAAHGENDPASSTPVITELSCEMVEALGEVRIEPGSHLAKAYGNGQATETYHCRYGFNPRFESLFASGPLRVTGRDAAGEVRAVELQGHPFFVATLFQPERAALSGRAHPVVNAFVAAASRSAGGHP